MLVNSLLIAVSAAALAMAGSAVGSGKWIEDYPGFSTQQCEGGEVSGDIFSIPKSPNGSVGDPGCSDGRLRAERRYSKYYAGGTHQFGGTFRIDSMSGDRISIKQTFKGTSGPYFIMAVEQGGRLYSVAGDRTIAERGVAEVGESVDINTVHDALMGRFSVYVNGKETYRHDKAPGGKFHDRIGAYTTDSGSGDLSITWSDVQFWHLE